MYKAPAEVSSEQFCETDERRGFARGFSIQTVGPLPIAWAEHVLANGHSTATRTSSAAPGPQRARAQRLRRRHRVWDTTNVFIADGSALPTQGAANPALTIMATASRLAERLARRRVDAGRAAAARA
jgi:choline dehydrogenase-like flavoprotein